MKKLINIISLDETSISPAMIAEYSRCESGKRCVVKTDDNFFFRKFTLLVAIKNTKCIGWILYEKGGMTKEQLVEFMTPFILINCRKKFDPKKIYSNRYENYSK